MLKTIALDEADTYSGGILPAVVAAVIWDGIQVAGAFFTGYEMGGAINTVGGYLVDAARTTSMYGPTPITYGQGASGQITQFVDVGSCPAAGSAGGCGGFGGGGGIDDYDTDLV